VLCSWHKNKKPHLPVSPVLMEWLNLEGIGNKKEKKYPTLYKLIHSNASKIYPN
jgi:hypothetical protein